MAEWRKLHKRITRNRRLCKCSILSNMMYRDIIAWQDDYGLFTAEPVIIKSDIFPFFQDVRLIPNDTPLTLTLQVIDSCLAELKEQGLIELGKNQGGEPILKMIGFEEAQYKRPDRPKRNIYGKINEQMPLSIHNDIPQAEQGQDNGVSMSGQWETTTKTDGVSRIDKNRIEQNRTEYSGAAPTPLFVDNLPEITKELIAHVNNSHQEWLGAKGKYTTYPYKSQIKAILQHNTADSCRTVVDYLLSEILRLKKEMESLKNGDSYKYGQAKRKYEDATKYFRPSTIFRPKNFDNYLSKALTWKESLAINNPLRKPIATPEKPRHTEPDGPPTPEIQAKIDALKRPKPQKSTITQDKIDRAKKQAKELTSEELERVNNLLGGKS